jgi:dienelactone hydrolase
MPAYRAAPAGARQALPVVLVISEVFGVHEHIADVARRFAQAQATWPSRPSCSSARVTPSQLR